LNCISLFSSAGIGCYGFKEENFKCIATNELLQKRLNIQKFNHKCEKDSGYILGDISEDSIKNQLFSKVNNEKIDVIIATPPCQGMSVANREIPTT
jgi:DNA (cytosine-5)-methyltransferase 1